VSKKSNTEAPTPRPEPVVIRHVKWRRQTDDPQIFPCADTNQFGRLAKLPRGTLIFIPEDVDYGPKSDEFTADAYGNGIPLPEIAKAILDQVHVMLRNIAEGRR